MGSYPHSYQFYGRFMTFLIIRKKDYARFVASTGTNFFPSGDSVERAVLPVQAKILCGGGVNRIYCFIINHLILNVKIYQEMRKFLILLLNCDYLQ